MSHHHVRGWEHEVEIMASLNDEFGDRLQALSDMRDRSIAEVEEAGIPRADLHEHRGILLLIFLSGIASLDAIRVLLEHGYPEQAHGLTRSLYDAEVDACLLADDPDLAHYYSDFEVWDLVHHAGRAVNDGLIPERPDLQEAVDRRRHELADAYVRADLGIPEGFEEMDLYEGARDFARKRWHRPRPVSWRPTFERGWEEILDRIIPVQLRVLADDEKADAEEAEQFSEDRRVEHWVAYSEMSARLHVSPRISAQRWFELNVGDDLHETDKSITVVASHFLRLHHVVATELAVGYDAEWWRDAMRRASGKEPVDD